MSKLNVWVTTEIQMNDFEAELEVMLPEFQGFNSGLARPTTHKKNTNDFIHPSHTNSPLPSKPEFAHLVTL